MVRRFVSIWFSHLSTDWFSLRQLSFARKPGEKAPSLKSVPFVLRAPSRGRMVVTAANAIAEEKGVFPGMVLADAHAMIPELTVRDDEPELIHKLLKRLAEWCIRFSPVVACDPPDGLLLEATGCPHLWGGDEAYLEDIIKKLKARGYAVRAAIADTAGVAWAVARFAKDSHVVKPGHHAEALLPLPPEALRLEPETVERLHKLGLHKIRQFIKMPKSTLRRRFGKHFIMRLDMALGQEMEMIAPVQPPEPYQERLPCLEPILTAAGIELALKECLEKLCFRLQQEQKGLRSAVFKAYRVDGKMEQVGIGTHRPSHHVDHIFKLFALKLSTIEPALGIELFILEAPRVEDHHPKQENMWEISGGLDDHRVSELIDRLAGKTGFQSIHRYLPEERYWPERSCKRTLSLQEQVAGGWKAEKARPLQLLRQPERIQVTAPIPDYPPMLFRYKGKLHKVIRADGPERIEQEWWIQKGLHRDYYRVEDEEGKRYWIFRLGHYGEEKVQWYIHGFFA